MTSKQGHFSDLTEVRGTSLTRTAADMLYSRYEYAASLSKGKKVLEIACGSGVGLGMVCAEAAQTIGGDIELPLLKQAKRHYLGRVPLVCFDAQEIPFADHSIDMVLFFEASYYLRDFEQALNEIARVLKRPGMAVLVNANPDNTAFVPSPHSVRYYSAGELQSALESRHFKVKIEGAFKTDVPGPKKFVLSVLRRLAIKLDMIPKTLRGRARIKKLFFRDFITTPAELFSGFAERVERVPWSSEEVDSHRIIYTTGLIGENSSHPQSARIRAGGTRISL